jgi:hypothetical protein
MSRAPSTRFTLIALLCLAVAGAWYVRRQRSAGQSDRVEAARGQDPVMLLDRLWVDSKPEKYTDFTQVMLAVSAAPLGIFQKASAYQATTELYEYKRRDSRLTVHFPQSGKTREVSYQIRSCDDLPPFDLCLDLAENPWGGPRRYFGLKDPDQEAALFGELRHHLEHHLPAH